MQLFDEKGKTDSGTQSTGSHWVSSRMSANPITNGGLVRKNLRLPDFRGYAVKVTKPGGTAGWRTLALWATS